MPNGISSKSINLPYEVVVCDSNWEALLHNRHFLQAALGKPLILSGAGPTSVLARRVASSLGLNGAPSVALSGAKLASRELKEVRALNPEYILAVGGGTIIDYAKILATDLGLPLILAPTTLSNDAMCSPVARAPGKSHSRTVKSPALIVLDVALIASGPVRLLISGIGDLIANTTACVDWELSGRIHRDSADTYNHLACTLALNAVYGFFAQTSNLCIEKDKKEITLQLARAHVLSGLAMSIAGSSRPCSGAEHLISHALDDLYPGRATHGEQVAVATYFILKCQGEFLKSVSGLEECNKTLDLAERYFDAFPLPRHPEDIGFLKDEFHNAVLKAPTIRDRTTILNAIDPHASGNISHHL